MNEIKNNNDSNKIKIQDNRRMLRIVLPLILALISMLVLTRISTSRDFHAKTIASLDDKKSTVMELTAASTAASAALTLLPGDTATPIAEKLADVFSDRFVCHLCREISCHDDRICRLSHIDPSGVYNVCGRDWLRAAYLGADRQKAGIVWNCDCTGDPSER